MKPPTFEITIQAPRAEHFCTYFDDNYLPRALLMIESLRRHRPGMRLHVLALSDLAATILSALDLPGVRLITLAELESRYRCLAEPKKTRKPIEYIFTLTPFLPLLCMETDPAVERITYVDADLYFYADPTPVFDEIGNRSIGIIPHRFSLDRMGQAQYGIFNVGWVTVRRTPAGIACLEDWRRDVVAWCHDEPEDGKFGDQGYLTSWPERHPDLHIILHKGANVAVWNADNYRISACEAGVTVDGETLIFYHFHGIQQRPDRNYNVVLPVLHGQGESVLRRRLYRPYLASLIGERARLEQEFPAMRAEAMVHRPIFAAVEADRVAEIRPWSYGWSHGQALDGWNSDFVSRCRLIDDTACDHATSHRELVAALAETDGGIASVLDFGGGFGGFATVLAPEVEYHVLDRPTVCDHAAVSAPGTIFHDDPEIALSRRYDMVVACASLQYVEDWPAMLARLAGCAERLLVLLDIPVADQPHDLLVRETPSAFEYRASFQGWIIARHRLEAALHGLGLVVEQVQPVSVTADDHSVGMRSCYILRREPGARSAGRPGR